jgi:copper(I)-binding protein
MKYLAYTCLLAFAGVALPPAVMADTTVSDAWVRAAVPGQPATGAFMTLTADTPSQLLAVQSPVARQVQIHQMSMKGDVMRMEAVNAVPLPAHQPVSLDPHGYHIMLMGLNGPINPGDSVPFTLTVEDDQGVRKTLEVKALVRPLNAEDGSHSGH